MLNVTDDLKAGFRGLSVSEALRLPVSALLGVNDGAADALRRIGIDTIFDLGSSWLFANASEAARPGVDGPNISNTQLLDALPAALPNDAGSVALESLRGLPDEDAAAIKLGLAIQTVRDFALWPPHRVAQRMMVEASRNGVVDPEEEHVEALRPRMGEYPTERVYYKSLVMLGMPAEADRQPLTGAISLQLAVDDSAGFGHPAIGAVVTMSQSWYAKGITLGHMLHSLALAPGEATRIAVVDWSKKSRATVSETIEEAEQLDNSTQHSRAISEVQNAVASEMQSGGSMSSGWSKSTSKADSAGFSLGGAVAGAFTGGTYAAGHGGGMGTSQQVAETDSEANSTSWSIGNRSVMAEMAQRVNDRTEQHSTSVRNRRASAVREVSQSEHEQVSTRVVANYNHMHALTVQYYEVVQVYRVMVQVHEIQRVLFVPFELLDFDNEGATAVVARFRSQLLAAAVTARVAGLLLDDRGEVEVRGAVRMLVPSRVGDVFRSDLVATARMARSGAVTNGASGSTIETPSTDATVLTAPAPAAVRRITSPGAVVGALPGDAELVAVSFEGVHVDRARLDQAGVPAENSTYAVPGTTFQIDFPAGLLLRNVTAVHVTKSEDDADSGTMTLHYRADGRQLTLPVPLDLAAGTSMQRVAFLAADQSNRREELMAHLQANRAYYSQAVLRKLDTPTLVMLLSRFSWKGKPLADQVEPKPLAVAGNYLVLRAPVEDDDVAGIDDTGTTWRDLLNRRGLTSEQRDDRLVSIPTGGVFAEAVLGRANSAEKLDITRFWNWQDSPIPLQPTEIAPISTGSRATGEDLRPGQLGAPVVNVLNPTALPEPAGLSASLNTLAAANLFRDMSGLAGTQRLAEAASAGTLDAAGEAGRLASANFKTATDQAVAMGQTAADMWKVLQTSKASAGGGSGAAGSGSSISADGARINHGRDMDERGVSNLAGGGSTPARGQLKDYLPSNWPSDAMGGSDVMPDRGGGLHPMSSEGAIAETQAMGVSPSMLSEVTSALKASVANPVPTTTLDNISHWKHLLLYKVSPEIVAFLGARNMRVQYAHEESFSNDLNTDYYAVRIKRFPTMNGAVLTPAELIRHIRLEINSFVDTSSVSTGSTLFHPYEPMDATTWVSDNPLKTVLKININPDNASVCVTSVTASGWTFSTVETPDTGSHPVSGTRTFFIVARDDVYYFVNKGLDMYSTGIAGGLPTGGAVAYWAGNVLWTGIQKNVAEFINSLGGDAKVEPRYSERVEWQLVYRRYKSELERMFGQGAGSPGNSSFFD